jgi:antitoxin (DNA-binding transcriptional repressor) of toxin-antitoxin stability system
MTSSGFYEARTHFSRLIDQVARGKKVLITRHGKPVAVLRPPPAEDTRDVRQVIAAMKALRRSNTLGEALSIRDLIEEGSRYSSRGGGEGKD